jgi:hypothetical protein
MVGKKGRSGRLSGSYGPIGLAGRHLSVLIEVGLALQPIKFGDRLTPSLMRDLAKKAFRHAEGVYDDLKWPPMTNENIDKVIAWSERRALGVTLRRRRRKTQVAAFKPAPKTTDHNLILAFAALCDQSPEVLRKLSTAYAKLGR